MKTTSQTQSQTPLSKLTICCLDSETQEPVAPDFTIEQPAGTTFTVENLPEVEGYVADRKQVCGCMPEWDKCFPIIVYYKPVPQSEKSDRSTRRFMATVLSVLMILSVGVRLARSAMLMHEAAEAREAVEYFKDQAQQPADDTDTDDGATLTEEDKKGSFQALVTITYLDENGNQIRPPHQMFVEEGGAYRVPSPVEKDHVADPAVVSGTAPSHGNVNHTVTYRSAVPQPIKPDTNGSGQKDPTIDPANDPVNQGYASVAGGQNAPTVDPAKDNLQPMAPAPIKPDSGEEKPASVDYGEVAHPNSDRSVPEGDYAPQNPLTPSTR